MTNTDENFRYDVAFSFLAEDEQLAVTLAEPLRLRLKVFIYSDRERQQTLAGGDGEEKFNRIFGSESRTVVVLHRQGWGDRGFTAVEATAIRNRAYEFGYDFTTFIPLDTPPTVPRWLPKNRIWYGLARWGNELAAAVIESRVQEAGGSPQEETASEAAARTVREMEETSQRRLLLDSTDGVEAARRAFEQLREELRRTCEESSGLLRAADSKAHPAMAKLENLLTGGSLTLFLEFRYSNTVADSELRVTEYLGLRGGQRQPAPQIYQFSLGPDRQHGWTEVPVRASSTGVLIFQLSPEKFMTTQQLAQALAKHLLARIGSEHKGR